MCFMVQGRAGDKQCILEFFCFQKELELKMNDKRDATDSNFAEILIAIVIQLVIFFFFLHAVHVKLFPLQEERK